MKTLLRIQNVWLLLFVFQLSACAQEPSTAQTKPADATKAAPVARKSNQEISDYVRKAFNVPSDVSITVTDQESKIPGMQGIMIEFKGERGSQKQEAWIAQGNVLVVGRTYDLTIDWDKKRLEEYKQNWAKIKLNNVPVTGAPEAKVTVVEYSDFQCPFCSRAHTTVKDLLKQYDGKIKVAFKHLPLTNIHNWAEDAAVASVCVSQQSPEAFWKLSDYFFTNQKQIKKETLAASINEFAKTNNLDAAQLQKCIADKATLEIVKADVTEANALGFSSTPSFSVNGHPVVGAVPIEQFKQTIDEELARTN